MVNIIDYGSVISDTSASPLLWTYDSYITLLSRSMVVDIIDGHRRITSLTRGSRFFRHDIVVVTVFYDDITSCNPLSNTEVQTAACCRHDRSAGACVLLP